MSSSIPKNFQNIFVTNITPVSNTSPTSITVTNITATNLVVTNVTIPNIILSGSLNANFNNNTLGNIFTTGGNVGINTTTPVFSLDISGSSRITGSLTIGNVFSTNVTSTNIVGTNSSINTLNVGNLTTGNVFSTSITSTNITSTNITSTNITSTNITSTNSSIATLNAGNLTTGNINFTGTLSQNGAAYLGSQWTGAVGSVLSYTSGNVIVTGLSVSNSITTNTLLATTNVSSSGLFSTNITSSNIFASNTLSAASAILSSATVSTLAATNISSSNMTISSILATTSVSSAGLFSTNITTTNLVSSFTSIGNLTSSTGTFANKVGTNQTVGTILVTSFGSLIGNSNTIGNIFTTGGNVGVGTVTPSFTLDIAGSLRVSSLFVNSSSIIATGGTTTLTTAANTNQFVIGTAGHTVLLPNSIGLAIGAEYYIVNQSTQAITVGNNATTTLNILYPGVSQFYTLTSNTAAGGTWGILGSNFFNASTGNMGFNNTNPGTSLDVIGSSRVLGMNYIGNPNNTADNLGIFVDGNNNGLGYRLGMIKKNGLPPFFATNNVSSYVFTVANNTDASQITTNSYTTVMTLSTQGHLTVTGGFTSGSHLISAGNLVISTGSLVTTLLSSNTLGNIYTTGGNVGINTSTPAYTLDINGGFRVQSNVNGASNTFYVGNSNAGSSAYGIIQIYNDTANNLSMFLNSTTRTFDGGINTATIRNDGGPLRLSALNTNVSYLFLSTSGNIGINTINPAFTLDISGSTRITNSLLATFNSNTLGNIYTTGGNVGIGINSPTAKLNIYNTTSQSGTGDFSNASGNILTIQDASTYSRILYLSQDSTTSAVFNFQTGKNIYWGETSDTGSYTFRGRTLYVTSSNIFSVAGGYYFGSGTGSISTYGTGTQAISIFASSAILTQTNFLASSDLRIKNICNEEINLNLIDRINPVIYTYKDKIKNPKKNIGFIAQNVFEFCPEAVTLHKEIIPDIMKVVDILENKNTIITIKNEWRLKEKDIIKIIINDKDTVGELVDIIYSDKDIVKFKHLKLKEKVFIYGRQVEDFHELNYDYIFALGFAGIQKSRKEIKELKQDNILLKQNNISLRQDIDNLTEFIKSKFQDKF